MDSILSDEPSVHTLPESESPSVEAEAPKGETPARPAAETKQSEAVPAQKAGDDDDADEGAVPGDLDGLKRALAAARGDKRKARKKWQETERQLAELSGKLSVLEQQRHVAAQPQKPKEDDDLAFFEKPGAAVDGRIERALSAATAQQRREFALGVRETVKAQFSDFEDAERQFFEVMKNDQGLAARFHATPPHAQPMFAYQTGKTLKRLEGVTSVDELEAKLRKEIEAEFAAKTTTTSTQAPARPTPPKSIAGARGSGVGVQQAWSGPRSIDDILG